MYMMGSALVLGTIISIWTWSDVLIACYAAPGVTIGAFAFLFCTKMIRRTFLMYILGSFLFCIIGATLSVGFVNVFGGMMTIILLLLGLTITYFHLKNEMLKSIVWLTVLIMLYSCACVFSVSVILSILGLIVNFLKIIIENLLSSYLFYVAVFFGSLIVIFSRADCMH